MSTAENSRHATNHVESEERLRRLLELSPFQSLPYVSHAALIQFYDALVTRLSLPFEAECSELPGPDRTVFVLELLDPRRFPADGETGLLCRARHGDQVLHLPVAELRVDHFAWNHQLIEDYWYWFWNWRKWPS